MEESEQFKLIDKKYTIKTKIYDGELSKVYLAEDQTSKKHYAIKIVKKESDYKKEVSILIKVSKINNPYIIKIVNYGEESIKKNSSEKSKYIILEYASKGDIFGYIMKTKNGLEEIYAKNYF